MIKKLRSGFVMKGNAVYDDYGKLELVKVGRLCNITRE